MGNGWSLGLVVPSGWAARGYQTKYSIRGVILEPTADSHLESDAQALAGGGTARAAHVIIIESGIHCVGNSWDWSPVETATENGVAVTGRKAKWTSQGEDCLGAKAGDREANPSVNAVRTLEAMTKDGSITVTHGK